MKNKLKCGLTLAALTFLVGCSDKEGIQRPSVGSGSTVQDSSSIINSESTSEIDPVELSNYQYYPLPNKTWAIAVGNNKYLEKLTLPEQYQGRKVTQIAENGFKDCGALREISIPSSVLTIGNYALSGCSALSNIAIPNSVTAIGDCAFSGCASLISIVVPEGVTSIGALAFDSCSRLTICCQAQSKPSGWNYNWNDFGCPVVWGCSGIGTSGSLNYRIDYKNGEESITITGCAGANSETAIPETIGGVKVTAIAESAFRGCTSLTSIIIPDGVTSIGAYAFLGCSRLTICCKARSKPSGWDKDWNLSNRPVVWGCTRAGNQDCFEYAVSSMKGAESATITGYTGSDTSITVPEAIDGAKVTAIADSAFEGCSSLKGIVIPEGVTNIGYRAFSGCTSLTSIVIPEGVTSIGAYAFLGCSRLTICCKARSKPSGWDYRWNDSDCPVVWGYSENGTPGSLN